MVVDQMLGRRAAGTRAVGAQREARQRVGGDVGVARAQLAPGDVAVAVGIEPDGVLEIAQRDVPLPARAPRRRASSVR